MSSIISTISLWDKERQKRFLQRDRKKQQKICGKLCSLKLENILSSIILWDKEKVATGHRKILSLSSENPCALRKYVSSEKKTWICQNSEKVHQVKFLSSAIREKLSAKKSTRRFVASAEATRKNSLCYSVFVFVFGRKATKIYFSSDAKLPSTQWVVPIALDNSILA